MDTQTKKIYRSLEAKIVEARKESVRQMTDIEHRLEFVEEVKGVEYINDAKSTDINSSWYSLDCLEGPIVWIVESCNYEDDLSLYQQMDVENVKALIISGSNPQSVEDAFKGSVSLIGHVGNIHEATHHASLIAEEGDTVLYSPSCSDFDQYVNYKEKGQRFRKAVREMQL